MPVSEPLRGRRTGEVWEWVSLPFHQQLFVRRRESLAPLPRGLAPRENGPWLPHAQRNKEQPRSTGDSPSLFEEAERPNTPAKKPEPKPQSNRRSNAISRNDPERMAQEVVRSGYDPKLIGEHLIALAESGDEGFERVIAFSALVARAFRAARDRGDLPVHGEPS